MEKHNEVVERTRQLQFARMREAKDWWKGLSKEDQRAAYAAWLAANPDDYRAKWGFDLASISRNSMESVWEHCKENKSQ